MTLRIYPQVLSPKDVAAIFGVDPKTVTRWATQGKIPSFKTPGGHHRFKSTDVQTLLEQNRTSLD